MMISPRLTDFGSLPKYESNPRRCFELYHSSLGYRMPSVNYKHNATKLKQRQRVVECETRDQQNYGMESEKKGNGKKRFKHRFFEKYRFFKHPSIFQNE